MVSMPRCGCQGKPARYSSGLSLRKSSSSRNGSNSVVSPKPKARRSLTPAPSRVGRDSMMRLTARMDMEHPQGSVPSLPQRARLQMAIEPVVAVRSHQLQRGMRHRLGDDQVVARRALVQEALRAWRIADLRARDARCHERAGAIDLIAIDAMPREARDLREHQTLIAE